MLKKVSVILKNKDLQVQSKELVRLLESKEVKTEFKTDFTMPLETLLLTDQPEVFEMAQQVKCATLICLTFDNGFSKFPHGRYFAEGLDEIDYDYLLRVYERVHGISHTVVKNDRISIREIALSDIDDFYALYDEDGLDACLPLPYSDREEETEYIRRYIETVYAFDDYGSWLIVKNDTSEVIGRIGLNYVEGFVGLQLGYLIKKEHRQNGYAYEACQALIEYVRRKEEFYRIRIETFRENAASCNLALKLGFEQDTAFACEDNKKIGFILNIRLSF